MKERGLHRLVVQEKFQDVNLNLNVKIKLQKSMIATFCTVLIVIYTFISIQKMHLTSHFISC
jgi:hypothetical protein